MNIVRETGHHRVAHWARTLFGITLCLLVASCSKSTKPKEVKHNIYIGSTETNQLYVLDAESLTVRDSIPGFGNSSDMVVSPDGRWLYISTAPPLGGTALVKLELESKQQTAALPGYSPGQLGMLKRGELILWGNGYFYGAVADAATLSDVRISNDSLRWRGGPETGTKIAVAFFPGGNEGPSLVRVLDIETGELTGSYVHLQAGDPVGSLQVALHPDGRRVIVAGRAFSGCWVLVGDVTTGETLLQFRRPGCEGEIAISPDSSVAVITDPRLRNLDTPEPGIDVLDLRTLSHLKRFRPSDFGPTVDEFNSQVQFTSDSKKVIVAPGAGAPGLVRIIDLSTLTVEGTIWPDTGYARIGALGYGPRPR